MKLYIQTAIRWPAGCLIFFICLLGSCEQQPTIAPLIETHEDSVQREKVIRKALAAIYREEKNIRTGDLVTRAGADFTSESLRNLCRRDQTYSHCGIASWENDSLFIYHAMGGEWNPDEKLRRDSWVQFAEPYTNKSSGHYRFEIADSSISNLVRIVHDYYKAGLSFDMKFDLTTNDKMYCAEFVAKSYEAAGQKEQLHFNRSHIRDFEFIGPDDIFLHPLCKRIVQIVYK
ncbi:MAG: YiiX/YebB-like N1pC/P60 family cysteine hydrolase [Ferruginibacter sp.]